MARPLTNFIRAALAAALLAWPGAGIGATSSSGPSFACPQPSSKVLTLICASPALAKLDRKLNDDFRSVVNQGGIDGKALRADEQHWLATVRDTCASADCLAVAYSARDADLLDRSAYAASPAAYADTRPYPAIGKGLRTAQAIIGAPCFGSGASVSFAGTKPIAGFEAITYPNSYVVPRSVGGQPMAVLVTYPGTDTKHCRVSDYVALPPKFAGETFDQCHFDAAGESTYGVGIRKPDGTIVAYWSLDRRAARPRREPIHVLGAAGLTCQQPETGE